MEIHFSIDTATREPSFFMPYDHSHTLTELYYMRCGECDYVVNNSYVALRTGDILLIRPGDPHHANYAGKKPSTRIDLLLDADMVRNVLQASLADSPILTNLLTTTCKLTMDSYGTSHLEKLLTTIADFQDQPGEFSNSVACLLVGEVFLLLADHGQLNQNLFVPLQEMETDIHKALHYIDTMYASPLTLEQTAAELGLNPSYFSHKFHMITGATFKEYLTGIRLRNAARLLMVSDDSITKIALNCGFSSSNYFKDVFRQHYGVSPRDYRRNTGVSSKLGYGRTPDDPAR